MEQPFAKVSDTVEKILGLRQHADSLTADEPRHGWVREGAQAMLDSRCIHLTGEWDAYSAYRVERQTERLYPYQDQDTLPTICWPIAA